MNDEERHEEQWYGRMWGVYSVDGNHDPVAIFHNERRAKEWLKWKRDTDEDFGVGDYVIMRTDLYGSVWNNALDPDPKADGFENFYPDWIAS